VKPFVERLEAAVEEKGSCLVVGLDPVLERLPESVHAAIGGYAPRNLEAHRIHPGRAAAALALFCQETIDAVAPYAAAVKPNTAFFEVYGAAGWDALQEVCRAAKRHGLQVILDAKRGDLASTAEAYAQGLLGDGLDTVGPHVDALTVNPFLGEDGIRPFLEAARSGGKGLFVLVRTSNPSAADFQELLIDGKALYVRIAEAVARWGRDDIAGNGLSAVGAVVGATAPEQAEKVRAAIPRAFFLVPGYGAQGAGAEDIRPHFLAGGRGAVVNASRSVIYAYEKDRGDAWTEAVAKAAERARAELEAVRRSR
jgi:orotidine-5'-phosphate decarboxylase